MSHETIYLAGGCFWGLQELLRHHKGVIETEVGYMGDSMKYPIYRDHGNHAETVRVVFDSDMLTLKELLAFFFRIHNPCTPNRQGNDIGSSYRSAIFYTTPTQRNEALEVIASANNSGLFPGDIVTQVEGNRRFWPAEEEHQDYLQKYPNGYSCHYERSEWLFRF